MSAPSNLQPIITKQQATVLHRYAAGDSIDNIVATTTLNKEFVAAVVTDVARFDRGRARTLVQEYMAKNVGERLSAEPCEEIVARGTRSFDARARHLAKRIQDAVEALRLRLIEVAAEQEERDRQAVVEKAAREKVAAARAELDAARAVLDAALAELGTAGGKPATPVKAAPTAKSQSDKVVRAWAKEQGIDVPAAGRIRRDVIEQWKAAHTSQGATS